MQAAIHADDLPGGLAEFAAAQQIVITSYSIHYTKLYEGNVHTTGSFRGMSDFDPGPGTFELTSAGGTDIFVSKLDGAGNFLWAKQMGGAANETALAVAVDVSGHVYTTGTFTRLAFA